MDKSNHWDKKCQINLLKQLSQPWVCPYLKRLSLKKEYFIFWISVLNKMYNEVLEKRTLIKIRKHFYIPIYLNAKGANQMLEVTNSFKSTHKSWSSIIDKCMRRTRKCRESQWSINSPLQLDLLFSSVLNIKRICISSYRVIYCLIYSHFEQH